MAKITSPLLSLDGSGSIAQSLVFSRWKGRPYVRKHVIPANPQSTDQTTTRNQFSWDNAVWKIADADFQAAWSQFAKGKVLTDRNAFISQNVKALRGMTDLTGMVMSPGAAGGLGASLAVTPGVGTLAFTLTAPGALPSGWTILEAIMAIIKDQDPQTGTDYSITTATVAAPGPYTHTFSSLGSSVAYACGAWFKYQRSTLATDLAYGASIAVLETTS